MNIYLIDHIFRFDYEYNYAHLVKWVPYTPKLKSSPIKRLKSSKGDAFNSSYFQKKEEYLVEELFWPSGFFALEDLLLSGGNQAECGMIDDEITMFRVNPSVPAYDEPFPTYAQIAASLPPELNYFNKYRETYFWLVTQPFVDRVKELNLKGMRFVLRWDGIRSYPVLPDEAN